MALLGLAAASQAELHRIIHDEATYRRSAQYTIAAHKSRDHSPKPINRWCRHALRNLISNRWSPGGISTNAGQLPILVQRTRRPSR